VIAKFDSKILQPNLFKKQKTQTPQKPDVNGDNETENKKIYICKLKNCDQHQEK
jgi:hypothetical protein